jgi:hypothetical protein
VGDDGRLAGSVGWRLLASRFASPQVTRPGGNDELIDDAAGVGGVLQTHRASARRITIR